MNQRWKRAGIIAALLVGAPAYAQERSTTSSQGTGTSESERGTTGTQGSTSSSQRTGSTGSARTTAGAQTAPKGDLEEKIQELHAANEAEVQLGQVGSQQARSPEVKQYAEKLARDHQKNDEQLQEIAQSMGANLEGKAFQEKQRDASKDLVKLQQKQGQEFDKAFIDHMVKDHQKDVKEVEKAAKEARKQNQTELAAFLETTHTGLQGHLQEAQRIEKSLEQSGSRSSQMGTGSGAAGTTGTTSGSTSSESGANTQGDRPPPTPSPGTGERPVSGSGGPR